jgi:hypothetical protein
MSFKSYISVDVVTPKGFYDWEEDDQDVFWERVYYAQKEAEQAYIGELEKYAGKFDFTFDIESK